MIAAMIVSLRPQRAADSGRVQAAPGRPQVAQRPLLTRYDVTVRAAQTRQPATANSAQCAPLNATRTAAKSNPAATGVPTITEVPLIPKRKARDNSAAIRASGPANARA